MLKKSTLRGVVLEYLKASSQTQRVNLHHDVEELVRKKKLFPTREECQASKTNFGDYASGRLAPQDKLLIDEITWDLITERILNVDGELPFLRLTSFGEKVVSSDSPLTFDPDGYGAYLQNLCPALDEGIKQYAVESMYCLNARLHFAAAVMVGAAAEKLILTFLQAICDFEKDDAKKQKCQSLLERPNLPKIFSLIQKTLDSLIQAKSIPYSVTEGATEHLLSLFEMIRAQRNDAVHPAVGSVSPMKVRLAIQTFPEAAKIVYRLVDWFRKPTSATL